LDFLFSDSIRAEVARDIFIPIAQGCVVALLRGLFDKSRSGSKHFHQQQLEEISHEISDHPDFCRNLGLNYEDAKLALGQATSAILSKQFFTNPITTLVVDDNAYAVRHEDDHLVVEFID